MILLQYFFFLCSLSFFSFLHCLIILRYRPCYSNRTAPDLLTPHSRLIGDIIFHSGFFQAAISQHLFLFPLPANIQLTSSSSCCFNMLHLFIIYLSCAKMASCLLVLQGCFRIVGLPWRLYDGSAGHEAPLLSRPLTLKWMEESVLKANFELPSSPCAFHDGSCRAVSRLPTSGFRASGLKGQIQFLLLC